MSEMLTLGKGIPQLLWTMLGATVQSKGCAIVSGKLHTTASLLRLLELFVKVGHLHVCIADKGCKISCVIIIGTRVQAIIAQKIVFGS